jgi:hypothetical protein
MERSMIPEHVVMLVIVPVAGWVLYRWGVLIFAACALFHLVVGDWSNAALAACLAIFLSVVQALASWLTWNGQDRGGWRASMGSPAAII